MPRFIRTILNNFKEYIVLVILLILSLILITVNDNSKVKNIRLLTLGVFSSANSAIINAGRMFEDTHYIEQLEKRNAELMLEVNQLRNYGLENNQLRDLVSFYSNTQYNLIPSKIVSRLVSKISGHFIISKGYGDGIREGMPVITDKGLVGIVKDVSDNYSSIRTYENTVFKLAVKIQRSNVNGILNWDGKNLLIKNVPTTQDVEIGDRVVVSELSSILPPTIPVGIIVETETTLSGVLSNLVIEPYTKLNAIKNVLVIQVEMNNQLDSLTNNLIGVED